MGAWGRLLGSLRAVRPLRVALVSVAAGLALGGATILALEARRPQPVGPESLLASIIEAAPSGARAALVRAVRPALIEALVADDTRAAAATLIAEVPSGVIVLDVEGALARRAVRHAATLVESRPAEAGDLLVAQLERAWLPKDARRDATAALWGLLRRRAHRLTAERALHLVDVAVRRGDASVLPPATAVRVVGRIARAGFVPDAGGLPTAGRTLGPVVDALRRLDPGAATTVGRLVGPASGHGPAELLIGQLDAVAGDPDTPEVLRRDLAAGATVLQSLVALRSLGDAERALTHLEPLVETWPADPSLVRLRALLLRRVGLHDEATATLGVWLGRGDTAPELRLLALAAQRRGGQVGDELDRGAILARLEARSRLRQEARMAAAAGWRHMADRLEADARPLGSAVPLAVELLRRELFLADRRPDPAGAERGRAAETARALMEHALPGELTPSARCAVARALDRGGERRAALALLEGGDADSLDTIGRCLWRLGLRDRARATLDRAFDLAPSADHRARVALHRFTVADGLEDTLAWASKAASLGAAAASGPLLEAQAQLYSRRGQLGDACEILDVLVRQADLDADDAASLVEVASYHRSRWDCRGDIGDLERAAALLERAAVVDDDPIVLANQADVLSHLGIVRALGATLRVDLLLPASTSPDFLELAALGGSRAAVLEAARHSEELRAAVRLHEALARRTPGETDSVAWLARWHELMGDEAALGRLWAELPSGLELLPVPCASDPECVMALRDGWRRARVLLRRTDGRTRAAAAILLASAARDLAAPDGKALGVAEAELRSAMGREPLPEVEVALAQVLVAQVAAEKAPPGPDDLLPEVERLRSLPRGADDPRVDDAVALVLKAEQGGHEPTQMDADIVGLRDPEAAARLRARWAARPGVLVARQVAYALAPSDPMAVLGLAAALEGRGSAETATALRAEATRRGVLRR